MSKYGDDLKINQVHTSPIEFLKSYNKNIPAGFPQVSTALLREFKEEHPALFKRGDVWSLDQHRKKLMDWLFRHTSETV